MQAHDGHVCAVVAEVDVVGGDEPRLVRFDELDQPFDGPPQLFERPIANT